MTDELRHHGIIGMKWGVRRYQNKDGSLTAAGKRRYESDDSPFTASNGMKVGKSKNSAIDAGRKIISNRAVENTLARNYRRSTSHYGDTASNRIQSGRGEQQIRREAAALREYYGHQKDVRKNSGTKYLDRAKSKNKYYDAQEKVKTATTKFDRIVYNDRTRKKAAAYIAKHNMSVTEAIKKSKHEAIRNSLIQATAFVAVNGVIAYKYIQSVKPYIPESVYKV